MIPIIKVLIYVRSTVGVRDRQGMCGKQQNRGLHGVKQKKGLQITPSERFSEALEWFITML